MDLGDGRDDRIEPRAEGDRALLGGVGGAIMMGEKNAPTGRDGGRATWWE